MAMKAYTNNGKNVVHVGGKMIRPGETREVDETMLPGFKAKAPAAQAPATNDDPLLELLDKPIGEITPLLAALTDDELARLEAAESAGKTRKGLMAAIAEGKLQRAAGGTAGSPDVAADMAAFVSDLAAMEDAELIAQLEIFAEDEGRLALVQAEIDKRAADNAGGQ